MTVRRLVGALEMFGARRLAYGAAALATAGMGLAACGVIGQAVRQAASERAEALLAADAAAAELEHLAFVRPLLAREAKDVEIAKGESLALALARAGIAWSEINPITAVVADVFNPRRMRAGEAIKLFFEPAEEGVRLAGLAFKAAPALRSPSAAPGRAASWRASCWCP